MTAAAGTSAGRRGRRPGRSGRRRGTLALIGGLFLASALLRTGDEAGRLVAVAAEGTTDAAMPAPSAGNEAAAASGDRDAAALLEALDAREARVEARERDLLLRMQALRVAESEIDERLAALETAEVRLRETLTLARDAAETDLRQLTDVYARMKPKQAAALFEQMEATFAAGFLARMTPEAAAAIMAGLSPEAAYRVSVMLAGRNADVPVPQDTPDGPAARAGAGPSDGPRATGLP